MMMMSKDSDTSSTSTPSSSSVVVGGGDGNNNDDDTSKSNNVASILNGFDRYESLDDDDGNDDDHNNAISTSHQQQVPSPSSLLLFLFTPKYQYSTKNNPLCGICFTQWMTILSQRYHQIEWTTYWPRLVVVTLLSIFNSILAFVESLLYPDKQIHSIHLNERPVFILGHPRTGTTLLHSLLALDSNRFDICTTFCAGFPNCFLWFESIGKHLFKGVIDETRPMDNVPLNFDLPQEDELATNLLSGGISPYMPLFFMKQEMEFRPYFTFDSDRTESNHISQEELAKAKKEWTSSFLYLLKKLTWRGMLRNKTNNEPKRRLLLKSPVHTARIQLLLQLFPNAQFIYIHRHPYDVLRSAIHMADTTYWYTYLNTPSEDEILEFILRQYEILWETYEIDRQLLKSNQLIEVSFDELTKDPISTINSIYDKLQWKLSSEYKSNLEKQLSQNTNYKNYQRNKHKSLPLNLKAIVDRRWSDSFHRLGYSKNNT